MTTLYVSFFTFLTHSISLSDAVSVERDFVAHSLGPGKMQSPFLLMSSTLSLRGRTLLNPQSRLCPGIIRLTWVILVRNQARDSPTPQSCLIIPSIRKNCRREEVLKVRREAMLFSPLAGQLKEENPSSRESL